MTREELLRELEVLHPELYGWALSCCRRDADEADDALQSACVRILAGRAEFRGRSSFKTWVFGIIRNVAREQSRKRKRRMQLEHRALEPHETPRDQVPDDEVAALARALMTLPARQREVLQLVFYHDMTIEQASTVMGVSLGTARTHYERGKHRLHAMLSRAEILNES